MLIKRFRFLEDFIQTRFFPTDRAKTRSNVTRRKIWAFEKKTNLMLEDLFTLFSFQLE